MRKLLFAVGLLAAITLTPLSALAVGGMTDIVSNEGISLCDRPDANTSCDPDKAISCACGVGSNAATKLDGVTTQSACANACAQLASASGQTSIYAFSCFDTGSLLESRPSGPYNTGVCNSPIVAAPVEEAKPIRAPIVPILNVPIPGFDQKEFSAVVKTSDGAVSVNFMAVYLNAVYKFLMIAAALCAVLMVTLAGFQWTTARGKAGEVQAAKDKIKNVLIGVTLLLCAVSIGTLIDPRLSSLRPLNLRSVDMVDGINDSGETDATASPINISELSALGIDCQSGKTYEEVARSMEGKVTYRMGGKLGRVPPFVDDLKHKDSTGRPYREYCPAGTICLDCSGYADLLAKCTNNNSPGSGTASIFGSSPEKVDPDKCTSTSINGIELQPGDVIGWSKYQTPPGQKEISGHVLTYIGKGKVSDSRSSGRVTGTAVQFDDTTTACRSYANSSHGLYVKRR